MDQYAPLVYLSLAFAWSGLLVTPCVILRYLKMPREIYDLRGDVNLAAVYIEDTELMPALVNLIQMAVAARENRAAAGQVVSYQEIMDEVDYRPVMDDVQNAQTKVRDIQIAQLSLMSDCKFIWLLGIFHVLTVVGAAVDQVWSPDPWRFPVLIVLLTAAAFSFALGLGLIIFFEFRHSALLTQLSTNQEREHAA